VASVGNDGQQVVVYPAGLSNVIGVASTANDDTLSSFSNYGQPPVWVAAPGEGIVTIYPYGTYAAGWGTSFSTPFVTGTVALMRSVNTNLNQQSAAQALAHAIYISPALGNGRLELTRRLLRGVRHLSNVDLRSNCSGVGKQYRGVKRVESILTRSASSATQERHSRHGCPGLSNLLFCNVSRSLAVRVAPSKLRRL